MDTSHSNNLNNNQTMKLPIPKTQSSSVLSSSSTINSIMLNNAKQSSQDMLITAAWPPNNNLASTGTTLSLTASSLPVIPCQTLGISPIGKPVPNKRGRKPLQTMPSTKKHIQNLTNQRAFRQRRENYIRTLEGKANTYEILYNQAQEEIKSLKEQNELLKKQLQTEGNRNNVCGDGIMESIEPQHQQQHCASKKLCNNSCSNKATGSYCGIGGGINVDGGSFFEDHRHDGQQLFLESPREEISKNHRGNDIVMSDASALSPSSCCSDGSINMTTSTSQSANNSIYVSASTNHFQPQCLSPTSPPDKFASISTNNPAGVVNVLSPPYHQNLANAVTTPYTFNEQQHRHQQQSPPQTQRQHLDLQHMRPQPQPESVQQSCSPSPSRQISASDIINETVFCETKDGDLCYCEPEPVSGSPHNIEDPIKAEFQAMGSQPIINEKTGKKMWIIRNNSTPTCDETMPPYFPMQQQQASNRCSQISLSQGSPSNGDGCLPVPALPSPEESESQHWQLQSGFYNQAPAAASTVAGTFHHSSLHHPQQHQNANNFDYKWIVNNIHREEQCA